MHFENQNTTIGSGFVAQIGSIFALNTCEMNCSYTWIIDLDASYHMTISQICFLHIFSKTKN